MLLLVWVTDGRRDLRAIAVAIIVDWGVCRLCLRRLDALLVNHQCSSLKRRYLIIVEVDAGGGPSKYPNVELCFSG